MPVDLIINNNMFLQSIFDVLTISGMIYLRIKRPRIQRPLKVMISMLNQSLLFQVAICLCLSVSQQ